MDSEQLKTIVNIQEKNYRLNIKKSSKDIFSYEYTIRADTIEELDEKSKKVQSIAKLRMSE